MRVVKWVLIVLVVVVVLVVVAMLLLNRFLNLTWRVSRTHAGWTFRPPTNAGSDRAEGEREQMIGALVRSSAGTQHRSAGPARSARRSGSHGTDGSLSGGR